MSPNPGSLQLRKQVKGRWYGALAIILAGLVCQSSAGAIKSKPNATPRQWLIKAARAADKVTYRVLETTKVKSAQGEQVQKLNLSHIPDATRREYLDDQGKMERIVVEAEHYNWQYLPAQKEIIYSPSLRIDRELWEEQSLDRLFNNYEVKLLPAATLAGRPCQEISISPRRGHLGPSKKLWVDKATGLILQSELISADGATSITSVLSGLQLQKEIPAKEFSPPASANKQSILYEHMAVLPLSALAKQWRYRLITIKQPPAGYYLESARLVKRGRQAFVHLRYFDGLNTLSLFQAPAGNGKRGKAADEGKGAELQASSTWRYDPPFTSLSWSESGEKLTLVGDLPKGELLRMGKAVAVTK